MALKRALRDKGFRYGFFPCLSCVLIAAVSPGSSQEPWVLVHHETFDASFNEPAQWVEDVHGEQSPYHVGPHDDDGEFFFDQEGSGFQDDLESFRSFRKSYAYGEEGWLTVELYGRDSDRDGVPESGGGFASRDGKALLTCTRHYDGGLIRPTRALPAQYRVEVTVSNINFGGEINGDWEYGGRFNGYDGDESPEPWRPGNAYDQNGVYFLCITDYPNPAPHNNAFIHHHRKVFMDTDNNNNNGNAWSMIWDPVQERAVEDGSHYISMVWLNGEDFGSDMTGNEFVSYTTDGWKTNPTFVDKYLDGESYVFAIERYDDSYTMSVTGRFYHGGERNYTATRSFRQDPVTWHYNQTAEEYTPANYNQVRTYGGEDYSTWPEGSAYPDFFIFGDPHINYYEGMAEFDDLKFFIPESQVGTLKLPAKAGLKGTPSFEIKGIKGEHSKSFRPLVVKSRAGKGDELFDLQGKFLQYPPE
ncbi:hypothetical protein ACFL5V_12255 [Fibrobacterota bacterium]